MTNIETKGKLISQEEANAQAKPMKKLMSILDSGVVATKEDCKALKAGYIAGLKERPSISESSYPVMSSRIFKIAGLYTATDKKLCELHDIKTPEQGVKLVKQLVDLSGGIPELYERCTNEGFVSDKEKREYKNADDAEANSLSPEETLEALEGGAELKDSDVLSPLALLEGYFSACKKNAHTPDEVFNLFQRIAADRESFDKLWKAVATKHK